MGASKYSNETKSDCIYYGYIPYVKHKKKEAYKSGDSENYLFTMSYLKREKMTDCALRLIESENRKYRLLRSKITDLVKSGKAVFITLTFREDVLSSTSAETRRRYVARYLKSQSSFYVANIDFSPEKNREHYHGVVINRIDMEKWPYGFVFAETVRVQDFNAKRVSRYIAKLTNHALKVKQLSTRLIYSRDTL